MVASDIANEYATGPPRENSRGGPMHSGSRETIAFAVLLTLCIATRLATSIHYIEDPDSLRFALSMVEFDVSRLQPHFPGYVVFVALARMFTSIAGSFAVGFALVGGAATFLLVTGLLRLLRWPLVSLRGITLAFIVLTNGMIWIYGNRYMPDLLGSSLLVWSLHDLSEIDRGNRVRGAFATALLAGSRLSYMPFMIPSIVAAFTWRTHRIAALIAFSIGIALWASALLSTTPLADLVAIATNQTTGHFDEFGGTIRTEPNLVQRASSMLEGFWTDALGGYARDRSWVTVVAGAGSLIAIALSGQGIVAWALQRRSRLVVAGIVCYLVWIFLFQNVIHNSRHLLPLVPFVLVAVADGLCRLKRFSRLTALAAFAIAASIAVVGARVAHQHRDPTAIAQVRNKLANTPPPLTVVSTALINNYLASTGVRARFFAVDDIGIRDSIRTVQSSERIVSVGDYRAIVARGIRSTDHYYHNPHVNRIWPHVELYEFDSAGQR